MDYTDDDCFSKHHRAGKCPNSVFADGGHRVGKVPYYSLVDGGCPGDVLKLVCLECGREWRKPGHGFNLRDQPNKMGQHKPAGAGGEARP